MVFSSGSASPVCAHPVRGAAACAAGPSVERSRPCRRIAAPDLRSFPVISPRVADAAPGRHRRYRRREPAQARPVAVAAHPRGGADRPADQARGCGHRLRRRFRRARPAFAVSRRRCLHARSTRKRGRSCAPCRATTRSWPTRCARSRVVLGEVGTAGAGAAIGRAAAADRRRFAGRRSKAVPVRLPGIAAEHPYARQRRGRARAVQHHSGTRRHRPARADGHAGPGHDRALADVRDAAGRRPERTRS